MDMEKTVLRISGAVLAAAILLRFLSGGIMGTVAQALSQPQMVEFMLFLQTGRVVRTEALIQSPPQATDQPDVTEPAETEPVRVQAAFAPEDAALVEVNSSCGYDVDIAALLQQPIGWDLTQDGPAVLILHTHGTEGYVQSSGYRSEDVSENVVSIGERVAQLLEAGGIRVLHDRSMHDQTSYNGSYNHAREAIEAYLAQYPSIRMVLDIHRDAAEDGNGNQIAYTVPTDSTEAAKLMLVVGTDADGLTHPNWRENMALAVQLHAQLQKLCPELCRPISFRSSRFNQDLSPGALLVEVGAAGNTRQEALRAAELLAEGVLALAYGTNG